MSVLAAVAVLAELCSAPPDPAPARDLADSAAYTAVGDDARATGDLPTAAIAYRKALALDPENRRATAGLAALCDDAASDGPTLLDAIARYRAGDPAAAGTALSEIVRGHGSSSTTAGAHFFLGLIALEQHDTGAAVRELELARADPEYRALAAALLRLAHRDGALAVALLVEPELDTNPQLVPDTPPLGAATGAGERRRRRPAPGGTGPRQPARGCLPRRSRAARHGGRPHPGRPAAQPAPRRRGSPGSRVRRAGLGRDWLLGRQRHREGCVLSGASRRRHLGPGDRGRR